MRTIEEIKAYLQERLKTSIDLHSIDETKYSKIELEAIQELRMIVEAQVRTLEWVLNEN
jgi:hypothetical protein